MTVFVAPVAKASINPPFNNDVISRIPWRLQNKSRPLFEYLSIEMYVGCGIRFRTPSINGRPISAEKDSFLSIVGTCVEQKNVTLYTVQGRDTLLLPGVIRPNTYRPETYENGQKSSVSGRWLLHRKTKRSVRFNFIAIWVHSHSAHSRGFEQSFLATGEHGFVEPETLGSVIIGHLNA